MISKCFVYDNFMYKLKYSHKYMDKHVYIKQILSKSVL